jgi:hypothetical protein
VRTVPISGVADRCAGAASGHDAAAPIPAMNSRRFIANSAPDALNPKVGNFRRRSKRSDVRFGVIRYMRGPSGKSGEPSRAVKIIFRATGRTIMARKYSKKASAKVERAMKKRKAGTLKSGRSGKKVTSRKQAIAIGLSEARAEGKKVPKKKTGKKKAAKKSKRKSKK